jgi:hypothetical protein
LLVGLAVCGPARAQSNTTDASAGSPPAAPSADDSTVRHCWFTVFEAAGDAPADICYDDPSHHAQPLVFNSFTRSESYEYKGPGKIVFFRQTPAPPTAPDGTPPTRELFSTVELPADGDHFLLLFLPDAFAQQNKQPIIYAIDDSTDAFPFGSVRLFNATKNDLAGAVGNDRIPVLPGASQPLPERNGGAMTVALAVYFEGKARLSFANSVHFKRGARTLLILVPSLRPGSIQVNLHTLEELPGAKPNPKTTNPDNVAQAN